MPPATPHAATHPPDAAFPMGRAVMIVVPSHETSLLEQPLLEYADRTAVR